MKKYALLIGVCIAWLGNIQYAFASCPNIPICDGPCWQEIPVYPNPSYIQGTVGAPAVYGIAYLYPTAAYDFPPISGEYCEYWIGTSRYAPVEPYPALLGNQVYPNALWNHGYASPGCASCYVNSYLYIPAVKSVYNSSGTLCGSTTGGQAGITWWNTGNPACFHP